MKGDIICLQETWLEPNDTADNLQIPGYILHLNSYGKGKGIAIYFKENIAKHQIDINENSVQISKFSSPDIDIVVLYRSQTCKFEELKNHLQKLTKGKKAQLIIGDFNFCQLTSSTNIIGSFLRENNFTPLISEPTHHDGNILDQAHFRDSENMYSSTAQLHTKYYTDHKGLAIIIKKGLYNYIYNFSINMLYSSTY